MDAGMCADSGTGSDEAATVSVAIVIVKSAIKVILSIFDPCSCQSAAACPGCGKNAGQALNVPGVARSATVHRRDRIAAAARRDQARRVPWPAEALAGPPCCRRSARAASLRPLFHRGLAFEAGLA